MSGLAIRVVERASANSAFAPEANILLQHNIYRDGPKSDIAARSPSFWLHLLM